MTDPNVEGYDAALFGEPFPKTGREFSLTPQGQKLFAKADRIAAEAHITWINALRIALDNEPVRLSNEDDGDGEPNQLGDREPYGGLDHSDV